MNCLEIKKFPDKVLRQKCQSIEEVSEFDTKVLDDMVLAMHHYRGIGLAAPQVGILKRFFVADIGEGIIKMANPEIVAKKGMHVMDEGCLSLPGIDVDVARPAEIIVRGIDENNKKVELKANGLLAKVIQHEMDHLEGKLIINHINLIKKLKIIQGRKDKKELSNECQNIV